MIAGAWLDGSASRSEFEPFRRSENGPNTDLDANIECDGCVTETVGGRRCDVTNAVTAETALTSCRIWQFQERQQRRKRPLRFVRCQCFRFWVLASRRLGSGRTVPQGDANCHLAALRVRQLSSFLTLTFTACAITPGAGVRGLD